MINRPNEVKKICLAAFSMNYNYEMTSAIEKN